MKDIVSFETALALEKAGFPQPEPEAGQLWYTQKGTACICLKVVPGWITFAFPGDRDTYDTRPGQVTFAPSVTDLLRELPQMSLTFYSIGPNDDEWWMVEFYDAITPEGQVLSEHPNNPAEALAAAWLEKNKTQ